ncbi:ribonuclease III [Capnocytophaga sp. oral taxon 324]|uniref:ribonuclease III n=1 Tax=Capnocytophaga sp. oral taxon 324 TaxID=712211 RepID=UPI0002A37508|nr:ribonuclease III [Capnocytophaga sp. oral taxon 324]EKY12855.1 ribonuclease III [Capnocytophaga sp. oral taxon 324 str. F0483]
MFGLKKILTFPRLIPKKKDGIFYTKIKELLGFPPKNLSYYSEAFTHPSYQFQKATRKSYERLEFLGDAILGAVIADYIFTNAPEQDEGYLTKMRSKIVERRNLNQLGKDMRLLDFLRTKLTPRQLGNNITGNLFEALIGAIYLDRGYKACFRFIERELILPYINIKNLEGKVISHKSLLIEWCQKHKLDFAFEAEEDIEDCSETKFFVAKVHVQGFSVTRARSTSKKKAEEIAAKRACYKIQGKQHHKLDVQ